MKIKEIVRTLATFIVYMAVACTVTVGIGTAFDQNPHRDLIVYIAAFLFSLLIFGIGRRIDSHIKKKERNLKRGC